MNDSISPSSRTPRIGGANATNNGLSFWDRLTGWVRGGITHVSEADLRESVEEVLEEHEDAGLSLDPEQREMLLNILSFSEVEVEDVMVPRADIMAVDIDTPLEDLVANFQKAHHSRLPVFRETLDEVVGFVHIKDVLKYWRGGETFDLAAVVRQPLFVPHSMPVAALLLKMRASRIHMALVVDEYGGADGLVTIEDVVEEIIGEIEDEHDLNAAPIMRELPNGDLEMDARLEIEDLEERLGIDLLPDDEDEEVDTLGGMLFSLAGRVPDKGEVIDHSSGLKFMILEADPRRIKRVRLVGARQSSVSAD
jgi:CBS domain containing-hemolysin-like protein